MRMHTFMGSGNLREHPVIFGNETGYWDHVLDLRMKMDEINYSRLVMMTETTLTIWGRDFRA